MLNLVTPAIVLHSFDYLESSRIFRLATREAGVQSVLARGAKRSRARFGSAMGLFSSGIAHVSFRDGRDLHTITSFEVTDTRSGISAEYSRFLAASMVAELVLSFSSTEASPTLYDALDESLTSLSSASAAATDEAGLAAAWGLVAALGFAPSLSHCASCRGEVPFEMDATFSHTSGGVLCDRCGRVAGVRRRIPSTARRALIAWTEGPSGAIARIERAERKAHARLLREFVAVHLGDERALRAFLMWEEAL